jgi:hypothetical protein
MRALTASIRPSESGPYVDAHSALAIATALGGDREVVAELLLSISEGAIDAMKNRSAAHGG